MSRAAETWIARLPVAHRGLHRRDHGIPENTIAAARAAVAASLPIELDVRLSQDGIVVVFHDEDLNRLAGPGGRVDGMKAADIAARTIAGSDSRIPTFADFLAAVAGETPLLVEVKNEAAVGALEEQTWKLLSAYAGEFAVQSFNPETLAWFHEHAPDTLRGFLFKRTTEVPHGLNRGDWVRHLIHDVTFADFVGCGIDGLPYEPVEELRSTLPILGWTVRSATEEVAARRYCDNIIFENFAPRVVC